MPPEGDHHLIDDFYISGRRNFMPPLHLEPGPQGPKWTHIGPLQEADTPVEFHHQLPLKTKDGHDRFVPSFWTELPRAPQGLGSTWADPFVCRAGPSQVFRSWNIPRISKPLFYFCGGVWFWAGRAEKQILGSHGQPGWEGQRSFCLILRLYSFLAWFQEELVEIEADEKENGDAAEHGEIHEENEESSLTWNNLGDGTFQLPLAGYLGWSWAFLKLNLHSAKSPSRLKRKIQRRGASGEQAEAEQEAEANESEMEPIEPKETDANDADAAKEVDKGGKVRLSKAERRRGISFRWYSKPSKFGLARCFGAVIAPTSSDTAAAQSRTVPLQEDPLGQTASTASISGFGYARRQRKDGEDQADCVEVDESSVWVLRLGGDGWFSLYTCRKVKSRRMKGL